MIGILALQGDVVEHSRILKTLGTKTKEVRTAEDLKDCSGLIIPGGESTTIMKLMEREGLDKAVIGKYKQGMAIFGTCAGAIVLAKDVVGNSQKTLGLIDVTVKRNDYGRQVDSFEEKITLKGDSKPIDGVFIRAPVIKRVGLGVERLAVHDGDVVVARQRHCLISTFHPELVGETRLHKLFLEMAEDAQKL